MRLGSIKLWELSPAGNPSIVRRYVQGQAIMALAMVADANEATFGKVRLFIKRLHAVVLSIAVLFVASLFYYAVAPECTKICRSTP